MRPLRLTRRRRLRRGRLSVRRRRAPPAQTQIILEELRFRAPRQPQRTVLDLARRTSSSHITAERPDRTMLRLLASAVLPTTRSTIRPAVMRSIPSQVYRYLNGNARLWSENPRQVRLASVPVCCILPSPSIPSLIPQQSKGEIHREAGFP